MSHHDFTRRDGSRFTIKLTIDHAKVADDMARVIARKGTKKAKKLTGAIVAEVVSDTRNDA